ncbi:MAG: tyrosine-type recombinase/integrase [Bosea sp.]|uniref:tyrosine-type recombinase/integrase n=1 Tax=Bosea sp. (in: a-proteobacteria) TaxID=1871050 RepID=UPI001AC9938A|nr:site-specific integrase [Bosea sp. (in: a-proteobacteria)]MBN9452692.1 tyrosine-type recombinase/integrase [Bosea sp. (in: a-proteobacteria)]
MAESLKRLTLKNVFSLSQGRHADGGNLYLVVDASGARRWLFMFRWQGKQREMGLGGIRPAEDPKAVLERGRAAADSARKLLAAGINPLDARRSGSISPEIPTFGEFAESYVETMSPGWRNPKHIAQWKSTLGIVEAVESKIRINAKAQAEHLVGLKALRATSVSEVGTDHVLQVLSPIWQLKPETASRLRGRIEAVLAAATAKGHRSGPNPAQWRNHLDTLLSRRRKALAGHHAAMPYKDVPAFLKRLSEQEGRAAPCLEFTILTAARSGEALGATWAEIDLQAKVWTVPGERMKGGRPHRVPLCDRALVILNDMREIREVDGPTALVFQGMKRGKPQSNMAMAMLLRRMGQHDATVHGFRSSFRDWAGEETAFPREVAEAALAHIVGDETERAYRRGDALSKRRELMDAWSTFCAGAKPEAASSPPAKQNETAKAKRPKTRKQGEQGEQGWLDL